MKVGQLSLLILKFLQTIKFSIYKFLAECKTVRMKCACTMCVLCMHQQLLLVVAVVVMCLQISAYWTCQGCTVEPVLSAGLSGHTDNAI